MSSIPFLTFAIVAAVPVQPTISATSPDRSFNIIGFYCNDTVCDDVPRSLGDSLTFDQTTIGPLFANLPRHRENWTVWLNCAVSHDKLQQCRLDDETGKASIGQPIALQLAGRLRLMNIGATSPRAIVQISYDIGGCPIWDCVIEPPAPLAPTPG